MRLEIAFVFVVAAACGNKKADAPAAGSATGSSAGSGSSAAGSGAAVGSGSAAPNMSTVCMPRTHQLSEVVADDKTATVCWTFDPGVEDTTKKPLLFDDETKKLQRTCMVVDLATGTWREAKAPPPAKPAPAAFEVKQDAKGVRVCKGAACTKLAVPPQKKAMKYLAAVSDDGKRAMIAADSFKGAWWFDATTGEKVKELPLVGAGKPLEEGVARSLGERVYLALRVDANSLTEGTIYTWAGDLVGKVDKIIPPYASLFPAGGDFYAFSDVNRGVIEIVDARSGKASEVKLSWSLPPVQTSPGKLVAVNGRLLVVVDLAAGTIEKQIPLPTCAQKPVAMKPLAPSLVLFGDHALGRIGNELIAFASGGDGAQAAPAEVAGYKPSDAEVIVGSGETAYAKTFKGSPCVEETNWSQVVGDGPSVMDLSKRLPLLAADTDGTFWAASTAVLYKLTKQGRQAVRLGAFPENGEIVRSEPTRLLVVDPLGAARPVFHSRESFDVKAEVTERRLVAIDKTTGETTELVRGQLGFVRAMGDEVWILRGGTELLSIGEGAKEATPRGNLPADALAVGGSYLYFHDAEAALIGRIALGTGKLETVVASAPAVGAMAADAGGVYWWDGITKSLEAASAPGAKRTLVANGPKPDGLAAGGGRVALRAGDRLTVVSAKDGASRTITLGSAGDGVAGDDTYVYWTEADAHADGAAVLLRARWSGGDGQVVSRVAR